LKTEKEVVKTVKFGQTATTETNRSERSKVMEQKRHRGFVVGSDTSPKGQSTWKVRVKDSESRHDGQKLVVASVRDGLELARGLNVHFAVGTIDDQSGTKILRAVDVCLENPEDGQTQNHVKRSGGQS
jgi:hypothetical protein